MAVKRQGQTSRLKLRPTNNSNKRQDASYGVYNCVILYIIIEMYIIRISNYRKFDKPQSRWPS
ncbi:hypothetical protein AM10699_60010 (plasmid) [Acaryochloris marina MBIC10699]|nr:hypothetical protein AM10699_60010 [Acaryochloris marina MBIC10699]